MRTLLLATVALAAFGSFANAQQQNQIGIQAGNALQNQGQQQQQQQRQRQQQLQLQGQGQQQGQANQQHLHVDSRWGPNAPSVYASNSCAVGVSAAGGNGIVGAGIGVSWADRHCERREDARVVCGTLGPSHPTCLQMIGLIVGRYDMTVATSAPPAFAPGPTVQPRRLPPPGSGPKAETGVILTTSACYKYDPQNPYPAPGQATCN